MISVLSCEINKYYTVLHLYSGIAGAALGFQWAVEEWRGMVGKFRTLAGIDCDPAACKDFEMLTGAPAVQMDLFSRNDYTAFHGREPGEDWHEVTAEDLRRAIGWECPDVVFISAPCKGLSGLLPSEKAKSDKYQALNRLTVRGLKLTLDAFADDLPATILFENVPRITTRGELLLKQIKALLKKAGYEIHPEKDKSGYHDCGELGGLGQHRRRYLLIARLPDKMTTFIYRPEKKRVKSIGEVIGCLPMPDDPSAGPMHRLPRLTWKTAVRLAMIPAGGDWRDLNNIAPEQYRIEYVPRGGGPFGVQDWDQPGSTVIGNSDVRGSNASSVADLRIPEKKNRHRSHFHVTPFEEPGPCVTGASHVANGMAIVADPRTENFKHSYRVTPWEQAAGTVTGGAAPSNGAICVSDPRLKERESRHPGVYRVVRYEEPAPCITGTRLGSGAIAIADPRTRGGYSNKYKMLKWDETATTVTGTEDVQSGAQSIADPRLGCSCRSGSYGVQDWDAPAKTVTGADIHSGNAAIADPRIPEDNERGAWIIIALDGTWHRPLTTWELLALQGFPVFLPDGSPVVLTGKSEAAWRERIGNAVPPAAAKAIAGEILKALLVSENQEWTLGTTGVWVDAFDDTVPLYIQH